MDYPDIEKLQSDLTKANETIEQQAREIERLNNLEHYLAAFLGGDIQAEIDRASAACKHAKGDEGDTAELIWRRAFDLFNEHLGKHAAMVKNPSLGIEPQAVSEKSEIQDARAPHLLLIAILLRHLSTACGYSRGLQSRLVKNIVEMNLNYSGLGKRSLEKIFSAAAREAKDFNSEISEGITNFHETLKP